MNRFRWTSTVLPACAVLAVFAFVGACNLNGDPAVPRPHPMEGKPAPDFSLKTVDGKDAKLSDLKGKVVVLDFWATWCPPCRESLPHIQALSQKKDLADRGLKVLAVNDSEDKGEVEEFLKKFNYTFNVALDTEGTTKKDYHDQGIPTTVVVGRDGTVRNVFVGYGGEASAKLLDNAVEAALK